MGDYYQQNQQVRRDQYNAGGNINQHRVRGYNQQGQQVTGGQYNAEGNINQYRGNHYQSQGDMYNNRRSYVESVGGDKVSGNKAGRDVVGKQYKVEGVKLIGYGVILYVVLGFLFAIAMIGGVVWFVSSSHLKIPDLSNLSAINPGSSGTPSDALKHFCARLEYHDLQGAYDDYSSHLKSQINLDQFTSTWAQNIPEICTSNIMTSSDATASGTIHMEHSTLETGGFVTHIANYNVTLVSNNGSWQIDSWQQAS